MNSATNKAEKESKSRNLRRSIRQKVVGRTQTAVVVAPPGFLETTRHELIQIISTLQTPLKEKIEPVESQGRLIVENASFANITEIALRAKCISDIRLRLFKRRVSNLNAIADAVAQIDFELFLRKGQRLRVRVACDRSLVNNEKQVEQIVMRRIEKIGHPCKEGSNIRAGTKESGGVEQAPLTLHVLLDHNVLSIELGLAGVPLYHRGYRASTSTLAPLREDLAASALLQAKLFFEPFELPSPDLLFIPFAGSGTLGFESFFTFTALAPSLFRAGYSLEQLACHSPPTFAWIKKQLLIAARQSHIEQKRVVFVERHPEQERELAANIERFLDGLNLGGVEPLPVLESVLADLFAIDLGALLKNARKHIFVPLNPPYGLRMESGKNIETLYRDTGRMLALLASGGVTRGISVSGFILCPDEATWEQFSRTVPAFRRKTTHFTQGGRDIRLCLFCSPGMPIAERHSPT